MPSPRSAAPERGSIAASRQCAPSSRPASLSPAANLRRTTDPRGTQRLAPTNRNPLFVIEAHRPQLHLPRFAQRRLRFQSPSRLSLVPQTDQLHGATLLTLRPIRAFRPRRESVGETQASTPALESSLARLQGSSCSYH